MFYGTHDRPKDEADLILKYEGNGKADKEIRT